LFRLQYFIDDVYEGKIIAVLKFTLPQFYLGSINTTPQKLIFGEKKYENAPTTGHFGFLDLFFDYCNIIFLGKL